MSNELLPCPFCGDEAFCVSTEENLGGYQVSCRNCGCSTPIFSGSYDHAIAAWNTRAKRTCKPELYTINNHGIEQNVYQCDCGSFLAYEGEEDQMPNYCMCCGVEVVS